MRKLIALAMAGSLAAAGLAATATTTPAYAASPCGVSTNLVGAVAQSQHRVVILNQNANWDSSGPVWQKTLTGSGWGDLSDVKFRTYAGRSTILVAASQGRVASIDCVTKRIVWQARPGGNPHGIELLPNGAIVVADSDGRVLYYPKGSTRSAAPIAFPKAHGVLYSDRQLWVDGGTSFRRYTITATRLTGEYRVPVPGGFRRAHDLAPMTGSLAHRMWLATSDGVYYYNKYDGRRPVRWNVPAGRAGLKSFGTQRDGRIVETAIPGCSHICRTDTVLLYRWDGRGAPTRKHLGGAGFYKARPVTWSYY